jgi:hypothetical protein
MRLIVAIPRRHEPISVRPTGLLRALTHKFSKSGTVVSNETSFALFAAAK